MTDLSDSARLKLLAEGLRREIVKWRERAGKDREHAKQYDADGNHHMAAWMMCRADTREECAEFIQAELDFWAPPSHENRSTTNMTDIETAAAEYCRKWGQPDDHAPVVAVVLREHPDTITIATLLLFDRRPQKHHRADKQWLLKNAPCLLYNLRFGWLPILPDGYRYGYATTQTVPIDSAEASAAINNSIISP